MSDTPDLTKFRQAIAAKQAEREAVRLQATIEASFDFSEFQDVIGDPDFEPDGLDDLLDKLSIVRAYQRWCDKSPFPAIRPGKNDGYLVSCPNPRHRDRIPSCSCNIVENVFKCFGCETTGDIYDIAAWHFGYNVPEYKHSRDFGKLRQEIADDLGYVVVRNTATNTESIAKKDDDEDSADVSLQPPEANDPPGTNVISLSDHVAERVHGENGNTTTAPGSYEAVTGLSLVEGNPAIHDIEVQDAIVYPSLDWHEVVKPGTFLDEYMQAVTIDSSPEEYHLFNGLLALGAATARNAYLIDQKLVYPNLFVCLIGETGNLKSTATDPFFSLLRKALPYVEEDDRIAGVKLPPTSGSGESLIQSFSKPVYDPNAILPRGVKPKPILYLPVTAVLEFPEMATLAKVANRIGSTMGERLIDLYDNRPEVSHTSQSGGLLKAIDPFCSVLTTTQPRALKNIMSSADAESGFINRWIFISGNKKPRKIINISRPDISNCVTYLLDVHAWAHMQQRQIRFEDDALELFQTFHEEKVVPILETDYSGFMKRLELLNKKLLLLLAINEKTTLVTVEMVKKLHILFDYLIKSYELPKLSLGNSETNELIDRILEIIKRLTKAELRNGKKIKIGPTKNDVRRYMSKPTPDTAFMERTFQVMERMDMIHGAVNTGMGPKTMRYTVIAGSNETA